MGELVADGKRPEVFDGGLFYFFERTEVLKQRFPPLLPDAGNDVQLRDDHRFAALLPMERDREAMDLVLNPL
ncbi:hypothetical protein D1872_273250 [compost metagenome]